MKKLAKIYYCNVALLLLILLLVGCAGGTNEETKTDSSQNDSTLEAEETDETEESNLLDKEGNESESITSSEESATDDSNDTTSEVIRNEDSTNTTGSEEENALSKYTSEEIEFARVWLQLGPNPEVDELNVLHIPAGEPINPNDDTSASYPENVIQLAGSRLVDGSVTYSGNGDGTINVYNVPLRWESSVPEDLDENYMSNYTQSIINDAESVYINPENDEKIIELIELLNVH